MKCNEKKVLREENNRVHFTPNQTYRWRRPPAFPRFTWLTSAISQTLSPACVCSNGGSGFVRGQDRLHPAASVSS